MHKAQVPPTLGAAARRPILVVAFLKNLASVIYLVVCVLIMLLSTPSQRIRGQAYMSSSWSPAVYTVYCLLHLVAMLPTPTWLSSSSQNTLTRLVQRIKSWMASDTVRATFQAIETTAQVLQGYHLSALSVDKDIVLVYALLISGRCLVVPWLLFSSNVFVKTTLILAINSLVSFGIAVGLAMVRILPPLLLAVTGETKDIYSPEWGTRNILLARFIFPTSGADLLEKSIVLSANVVNVRRLVLAAAKLPPQRPSLRRTYTAPVMLGPSASVLSLRRATSFAKLHSVASQSLRTVTEVGQTLQFRQKRILKLFLVYQLLMGATVLFNVIDLVWLRSPCPHGCQLQTHPWFTRSCSCAYLHMNCADPSFEKANLSDSLSPDIWGASVFFLHLSQCYLPTGLDLRLLARLHSVSALAIDFSNMTSWDAPPNVTWPPSLHGINLRYGNLTAIPSVFYTLPPQLQTLSIMGHPLRTIPSDLFSRWTTVTWLGLAGAQITSLPDAMVRLVHLERLILIDNQLSEIPATWATAFPVMQRYELSGNAISILPPTLVDAKPKALIDLSNNPVSTAVNPIAQTLAQI
ncbi:hypothetical protein SPRG_00169 [Saprolegnia parasitica CBS 223.65]|uniref:L domain-like protein n=1 Tax=Saprolegnia parasitica (strain CBS 223.65) TaxID=695850 RepID=A0A067D1F1_SAPPC|nr:hypothetical protein SPRG_00169 [Saprolegnia parasitica CBS 223.65]KDO35320.1 hypothetical protein SPRG_00169 [Saprolegnia parasitica CBS 223.65]|eukprot:XP_012193666.1 hypothetical protein SPRG_00169 [Saprolegnia parasitica CBS 223.65]